MPRLIRAQQYTYVECGQVFTPSDPTRVTEITRCDCPGVSVNGVIMYDPNGPPPDPWDIQYCCGQFINGECYNPDTNPNPPSEPSNPVGKPLTVESLKKFNPLVQESDNALQGNPLINPDGSLNPAGVINRALTFLFPLAGLILFVMLVWGGFEMLTGAASKKSQDSGKQRITAALIGFLLLFSSYWIVQIVEAITGVTILG
ncbi:MAG: hypothetical protein GF381_04760 [Candidatus Pacebacteria bacterium]|nr:hypothetical protein [Candidatus Paceibacterota bacterium]